MSEEREAHSWLCRLPGERELASSVAERWKAQYYSHGEWEDTFDGSSKTVYNRLLRLGTEATAQEVAAVIGTESWMGHWCNGCHEYSADA